MTGGALTGIRADKSAASADPLKAASAVLASNSVFTTLPQTRPPQQYAFTIVRAAPDRRVVQSGNSLRVFATVQVTSTSHKRCGLALANLMEHGSTQ